MDELLAALDTELRTFAADAAEAYVRANPRGFALFGVPISDEGLRAIVSDWDVSDWEYLRGEVRRLAVAHLKTMVEAGQIGALTSGANLVAWRNAARNSDHPLLRLMADEEFGGALASEVESAWTTATQLTGWDDARPPIIPFTM